MVNERACTTSVSGTTKLIKSQECENCASRVKTQEFKLFYDYGFNDIY